MAKNNIIEVVCFGKEIGRLGFDENRNRSFFQYNKAFLEQGIYQNLLFPASKIIRKVPQTQVFTKYNNEVFRNLPPQIADSLPDTFGNIVFKKWLEKTGKDTKQISVLEQLAYVGNRGMGALEYRPIKELPQNTSINLNEIINILNAVILGKKNTKAADLSHDNLLNIFKIGTSAGGARPKILIFEHKETGKIIPGDLAYSMDYHHYLVKFSDAEINYPREVIEYSYYLIAKQVGINMMPSKLIDDKYFATLRFDRINGQKKHVLTVTGLTGWNFKEIAHSSYENLFDLALYMSVPHKEIEQLFKRMVFNIIFANTDDHLKNHSFIYEETMDKWHLSPAYDLTYSLNPLLNFKKTARALSVNGNRMDIKLADILKIADLYTIKNAKGVIQQVQESIGLWKEKAEYLGIPSSIITSISNNFKTFALK